MFSHSSLFDSDALGNPFGGTGARRVFLLPSLQIPDRDFPPRMFVLADDRQILDPYAAESGSVAGPGAGSPNSRTSSRQALKASFPVTTYSMHAGARASNTASVLPTRKCP